MAPWKVFPYHSWSTIPKFSFPTKFFSLEFILRIWWISLFQGSILLILSTQISPHFFQWDHSHCFKCYLPSWSSFKTWDLFQDLMILGIDSGGGKWFFPADIHWWTWFLHFWNCFFEPGSGYCGSYFHSTELAFFSCSASLLCSSWNFSRTPSQKAILTILEVFSFRSLTKDEQWKEFPIQLEWIFLPWIVRFDCSVEESQFYFAIPWCIVVGVKVDSWKAVRILWSHRIGFG